MGPRALGFAVLFACGTQSSPTTTPASDEVVSSVPPTITEDRSPTTTSKPTPDSTPFVWPTAEAKAPALGKALEKGRPRGDRSRALPDWETSSYSLAPPADAADGELRGSVTAIRPTAGEKPGAVRIEAADGKAIELASTGPSAPPLAVGDDVAVKWRLQQIGIHQVRDFALVHTDGRLVYASSGSADRTFAPGWYVEDKGVRERDSPDRPGYARRESRWLLLALGDAVAIVSESDSMRRLETKDGNFAVHGSAISYSAGMRVPDSTSYATFSIARLE
jgi:hypothetical protein